LTALHFAAHQNFTELGMLLLQYSADPSAKDIKCALAYSAITLLRHQLPFLLLYPQKNTFVYMQYSHCICSGKTPADFASVKGHQELIELMRYSGIHAVLKRAKSESDEI
jgi:ankyrin repeat protein